MVPHQRSDGDILVDFRLIHADAFANQSPSLTLLLGGIHQAREPRQGCGNLPAIGQDEMQGCVVNNQVNGAGIKTDCQDA